MNFDKLVKERYSCRSLSARPVEASVLGRILEAASAAPTAKNLQPWKVWVVQSREALGRLRQTTGCHFDAPVVLVVGCDREEAWVRPYDEKNFAEVDGAIVATHIMLAVADAGLGTTWVGRFDAPKLQELFPEMAAYELIAMFPVGYPSETAEPSPRHAVRKKHRDVVNYL